MIPVFDSEHTNRTIKRISHEIIEKNEGLENIIFFAIMKKGTLVSEKISHFIEQVARTKIPTYNLDIASYRDDVCADSEVQKLSIKIDGKHIIIIDDVIYTGRSARAAMEAIIDLGRPSKIELVALVDRGHRELPIRPNYVGKNIPTTSKERVVVDNNLNVYIEKVG